MGRGRLSEEPRAWRPEQLFLWVVQVSSPQASWTICKNFAECSLWLVFREKYPDFLILYYSGTSRFLILLFFLLLPAKYSLFSGTFGFWEAGGFSSVTIFLV